MKDTVLDYIDCHKSEFEVMASRIWDNPELRFKEYEASSFQKDFLASRGFSISSGQGNIPTAFCAEYGKGTPVIAFLGEFDALPGLSQEAGIRERRPIVEGNPGHGCGHHMLGTGALEAACAVSFILSRRAVSGTVRYYGCPAEEGGAGKVKMIAGGAFDDVDVALAWHPQSRSFIVNGSTLTMNVQYEFEGKSAHAATNPHLGASALDAAELMNIGANFYREHMMPGSSLQYAFIDAGGEAANIIPDHAKVSYYFRAQDYAAQNTMQKRVDDIAQGAALMTGTRVRNVSIGAMYSNVVSNSVISSIIRESAETAGWFGYTRKDIESAALFSNSVPPLPETPSAIGFDRMRGSTDVGDVSHVVPTGMFTLQTFADGTALHSFSAVAQGKMGYAYKGMHRAARIMALTAMRLIDDPSLVAAARKEFDKADLKRDYLTLLERMGI